ncbi:MAG: alkaline phosphatase family protein [Cryomorphaceae bacterium]|nr:alkaline phosphatase family protein [Cryomorphaceae bacterium]
MRLSIALILSMFFVCCTPEKSRQKTNSSVEPPHNPKLVVGIVVDQMRYDYIYRYYHLMGDDGIKRLLRGGFHFQNTDYPYIPTYTGPGHASIYTGATPMIHGIIANNWHNRETNDNMYVTQDDSVNGVGTDRKDGKMSPKNMLTTTFPDEWKLFTQFRSKTIGIALKDRGAILPAGHTADAAYWYEGGSGNWISSDFYMDELPQWVKDYNDLKRPKSLMQENWNTLLPIEEYADVATADDNPYEGPFMGQARPTFPHNLELLYKKLNNNLIKNTPWGNTITFDMAKAAVENEQLGTRGVTDILTVSFSSPDYIGHQFGPRSIEVADQYLRFDMELAEFLNFLDESVGKGEYLLFFTADHGAADVPTFSKDMRIPAGNFQTELYDEIQEKLKKRFGVENIVRRFTNLQFYLDDGKLDSAGISKNKVKDFIVNACLNFEGVLYAQTLDEYRLGEFTEGLRSKNQKGIMTARSGDVILTLHPAYLEMKWQNTGTTHGTGYSYDTRVPLIFYGKGIPIGESFEQVEIIDLAPTISNILRMSYPNGNMGRSLLPFMNAQ